MKTNWLANSRETLQIDTLDWDKVYEDLLPKVFHFLSYKVGDLHIAEDLTAITFEKAWASRKNFRRDSGQLLSWIIGIARHVANDHFRTPSREIGLEELNDTFNPPLEEELQRRLDYARIVQILAKYSPRDRELIALKYGAELTNREIARLTGLSESNVGTTLHRVVSKLRKEWEKDYE
jgi:RNA polymerase sigma-70 factor (ECF subfamily)